MSDEGVDVSVVFESLFSDGGARLDESTTDGGLLNYIGVGFGMRRRRNIISEFGEIRFSANFFEDFVVFEFGAESEEIYGAVRFVESEHGAENFSMTRFVEIGGTEEVDDVGEGAVGDGVFGGIVRDQYSAE